MGDHGRAESVTKPIPMKRELKAYMVFVRMGRDKVTNPIPMKRELKAGFRDRWLRWLK